MKRLALAFLAAVSPLSAFAETETVTVTDESLIGPWRIGMPLWNFVQRNVSIDYGPMRDAYCRVEGRRDDLHVHCLLPRTPLKMGDGDMSLHGDAMHICWCDFIGGEHVDATQKTPGVFSGSLTVRVTGIPVFRAPSALTASRIVVSDSTPDAGGKSAVLAKLLAGIADGVPLSSLAQLPAKFPANADPPTAEELRGLGPVRLVAYLGHTTPPEDYAALGQPSLPGDDRAFLMQVYDVEFAKGERVCELRTREDGVVNGLVCA